MVCSYLLWQLSSCKFFAMLARHCDGPRHSCAPHLAHTLCIVYPQTKVTFSHQIPASVRTLCRILSVPPPFYYSIPKLEGGQLLWPAVSQV